MAVTCCHCMHLLVENAQELARRTNSPYLSYSEVAEICFTTSTFPRLRPLGVHARRTIDVFLCMTQLGFCCVYPLFVAQNLQQIFFHVFGEVDYRIYLSIILLPMLFLCSIRNLKYIAPFSMLANILEFAGVGCIFYYLLQDMPSTSERKVFSSWSQLPLYFGTAIYAFEGIGVVLPLENQMKRSSEMKGWNGVLNTGMILVSCSYMAVGFYGYLKYGEHVKGSITLNLPYDDWLAILVKAMMSLAIFFSYALQFHVPLSIINTSISNRISPHYHLRAEYLLRMVLVLMTFILSACIPQLGLFISLVGSLSSSTIALIAPPIIDSVTAGESQSRWRLLKNVAIFTVGFIGFATGTFVSIQQIIASFSRS